MTRDTSIPCPKCEARLRKLAEASAARTPAKAASSRRNIAKARAELARRRRAAVRELTPVEYEVLARAGHRGRAVLELAQGRSVDVVAAEAGVHPTTLRRWRKRLLRDPIIIHRGGAVAPTPAPGFRGHKKERTMDPYTVGTAYFFRTVTMYIIGRVVSVGPLELVVDDAAWVADSGRFAESLASGTLLEVEPYPDGPVVIGRGAITDAAIWSHPLPRSVR